jgi:hypothetical protein
MTLSRLYDSTPARLTEAPEVRQAARRDANGCRWVYRGRRMPPTASASPSVRIHIVLPAELEQRLRAIAKSRGIGLSTLVRMLLLASTEPSSSSSTGRPAA